MSKIQRAAITALLLAGSVSCSVYKEYERPEMPVVDSLYTCADTASIADFKWNEFFRDTLLQDLIRTGLQNNTKLRNAAQSVIEAQAALKASRLAFLPSVGFGGSASIVGSKERYSSGSAYGFSLPLQASWEVDITGKLYNKKRYAKAAAEQAELYRKSVQTELIATIATYYYMLEMLDAQLRISTSTAESWKQNVRIMKSMKEAGMANEASVSHTEANAIAIESSLFDLRRQIRQTENNLAALLGVAPRSFKRDRLRDENLSIVGMTGMPVRLLSHRPDVMAAEMELRKAFYNTAYAHAAFYPSLTITGEFGWEKALTSPAGWLISAGAGLVQPLFNRGALKANLTAAEARQQKAANDFRQALLDAGAEVCNAIEMCKSVAAKRELRAQQIERLKSAENSTRQLMRHSQSTYLEVLTAQQALLSARLLQTTDRFDAISGGISLYKSLGGGCD